MNEHKCDEFAMCYSTWWYHGGEFNLQGTPMGCVWMLNMHGPLKFTFNNVIHMKYLGHMVYQSVWEPKTKVKMKCVK
jgi:hypothetical protein